MLDSFCSVRIQAKVFINQSSIWSMKSVRGSLPAFRKRSGVPARSSALGRAGLRDIDREVFQAFRRAGVSAAEVQAISASQTRATALSRHWASLVRQGKDYGAAKTKAEVAWATVGAKLTKARQKAGLSK